ncbi:MAG: hypothetical protein LKJ88_00540 [Bacilli bacterium]|jgi:hypothetical protein|nr:hypothetical protein [Bacilli bacterium]
MKTKIAITAVASSLLLASFLLPTFSLYNKTISQEYSIVNDAKTDTVAENVESLEGAISSLIFGQDNSFSDFFTIQKKGAIVESYHEGSGRDSSFYSDMAADINSALGAKASEVANYSYTVYLTGKNTYDIYVTPIDTSRIYSASGDSLVWPVYKYSVDANGVSSSPIVGEAKLAAKSVKYYVQYWVVSLPTWSYVYYLDSTSFSTKDLSNTYASQISSARSFYDASLALLSKKSSAFYTDLFALKTNEKLVIDSNNKWNYYNSLAAEGATIDPLNYSYTIVYEGEDQSGNRIYDFYFAKYTNNGEADNYTSFIYRRGMNGTALSPVECFASGYYADGELNLNSLTSIQVLTQAY